MSRMADAPGVPASFLVDVALPVPLTGTYTYRLVPGQDDGEPRQGDLVSVPFGRRQKLIGMITTVSVDVPGRQEVAGHPLRHVHSKLPAVYRVSGERWRLAHWLAEYYGLPLGEVVPLFHPPAPGTRWRAARGQETAYPLTDPREIVLTASQQEAVTTACTLLEEESFGTILVHGVTGSGKTEVFLRVIAATLAAQRSALYLLPEIALTPQTLARITDRFGSLAATIHSGLSAGERCRVHEAAAEGQIRVVVGPRSALFVPLLNLGAVIVDEEHETSYKQDEKPRYHARHVALMRARENGAVVLLGSATPDLESFHNAQTERYRLVTLKERALGRLPGVEIVDMRGQQAPEGFSTHLSEGIASTLDASQQVILFYNRRGFARALQCSECGESVLCPRCDIALTVHLRPRRLMCHYCGFTQVPLLQCPACNSEQFLTSGGGTEKIELALNGFFPAARVLRLDHDATRRRGSHARILGEFAAGRAQILLGTQMVAKGHHFPGVGLVGVLAADDGLNLPDFRASERTFQLLTQVAGRTGRQSPGRAIFQTYRPDDPVIRAAAAHAYEDFVAAELPARHELGYPPYRRLIRVGLVSRRQGVGEAAACALADAFRNALQGEGRDILGPAPAVFSRLHDRFRFQILIKGQLSVREKQWLADCLRVAKDKHRGLETILDVDPLGLF